MLRYTKPVYINNDMFGGTFRRNFEGDYRCTRIQVKTMLRDQADDTIDMAILDTLTMDIFNNDSVRGYRNTFASRKDGHPFLRLDDNEFLRSIGAALFPASCRYLDCYNNISIMIIDLNIIFA